MKKTTIFLSVKLRSESCREEREGERILKERNIRRRGKLLGGRTRKFLEYEDKSDS